MSEQKELTKSFFNEVAKDWFEKSYDQKAEFLSFPTGKVRRDITLKEIEHLGCGKKAIDLGCGTGQLVVELREKGFDAFGVDVSENMIVEARKLLPKDADKKVFSVKDFEEVEGKFDVVTAMGLLEYLEYDYLFFKKVESLLNAGGWAFVECRNRLFNVASGNNYTVAAARLGDLSDLLRQLERVEKYSPVSLENIEMIQKDVFGRIAREMDGVFESCKPVAKEFPCKMSRSQHTPEELERVLGRVGLELKYVVYYHCHPFLPRYEELFPWVFNKTAFLMQPFGYTVLGSTLCSGFVAVIRRK